ncbi:MAG: tricarballylate utilization 4Fe-4S protein TcuB [Acetobacteraceae bacterium]
MRTTEAVDEARRFMEICNACRYCEGFCAVFPAMELRRDFANGDLSYLANLCHNCQGCYHACQYAPPHEFGINLPKTFAELRVETYEEYAWPQPMAGLFHRNGTIVSLVCAAAIALVLLLTAALRAPAILSQAQSGPGAFYAVIPWGVMTVVAGITFLFSLLALGMGCAKFWRDTGGGRVSANRSALQAIHDILMLRNLGGGGDGCNDQDESFSHTRRRFHHAMFYGFVLCFASTTVATFYDHFLGLVAPYPFFSLPVLLGTVGGLGMVAGAGGLLWLKVVSDPAPMARKVLGADYALLALMLLAAATGLLLLTLRGTSAMGALLAVHLGVILSLFLMLPYSKMVHGLYRSAALLRSSIERQAHEAG